MEPCPLPRGPEVNNRSACMLRERERGLCSELLMTKRPMLMREGVGKLVREGVLWGGDGGY